MASSCPHVIAPSSDLRFHSFPDLPTELRLKIWELAITEPRTVTVAGVKPPYQRGEPRTSPRFRANIFIPPVLHVCQESRREALAVYTPCLRTPAEKHLPAISYIYVSFENDTFYFTESLLVYLTLIELQGIRKLVLDVTDAEYFGHFNMDIIKDMSSLKTLDLFADKGLAYGWNLDPNRYISQLTGPFADAKELNPDWECPEVRVFNRGSKLLVGSVTGGKWAE
ncbi:hypothetical protein B0O99DRAFT_631611 [Bisporella sp. PMI_857]|nr:hypothetical protein B0O99DRAFT_631611 [Bisporella sp. PMI_857]